MVLRIALVQALRFGTPPHAAIATVLPLVDGGPRKLVHGVFGTLLRRDATLTDPPRLPDAVAARWQSVISSGLFAPVALRLVGLRNGGRASGHAAELAS